MLNISKGWNRHFRREAGQAGCQGQGGLKKGLERTVFFDSTYRSVQIEYLGGCTGLVRRFMPASVCCNCGTNYK
jgi:hypothetical protein